MKFSIEKEAFFKSLGHIQSVVEKRGTVPVLSNVKIEATGGTLKLTATDMEISITESFEAKVEEEGITTVPAIMLYDIIRKVPDSSTISFEEDKDSSKAVVKAGRGRYNLLTLPADNFPVLEQEDLPINFTISTKQLLDLVDKVKFAVSTEETRYYLNGVYVHSVASEQPVLRAAATDGHRLAHNSLPLPEGANGLEGIIIPKKTVAELRKLLTENEETEAKVSLSENKIMVNMPSISIVSKLIDGQYPDYKRVIPEKNSKIMLVNTQEFAAAVDRVSTISQEKARAVKLSLSQGNLVLTANNPDGSEAREEIEVDYSADPIEIGFNFRYLLDIVNQIEGETVQFVLEDQGSPAIVKDSSNVNVLYVLMPMRV